jgi:hypothetical protein
LGRNDPYFDPLTQRNVTALVGKSAYLTCRVRNLGNKTVSKIVVDCMPCFTILSPLPKPWTFWNLLWRINVVNPCSQQPSQQKTFMVEQKRR